MRRTERQTDTAFALSILEKCEYATLATINPDGTPYCIPISPVLSGEYIYFHCAPEGKKLDNIKSNPQVCLNCVGHTKLMPEYFSTEFESAVITGTCTMVSADSEKIAALKLICEKYAASNMVAFDNAISKSLHRTAIGKIKIREITGKAKSYSEKPE